MGPEGGSAGGDVIAVGTPEEVAQCAKSYTGQFVKPLLERSRRSRTSSGNGGGRRSRSRGDESRDAAAP
jgi:hypothetical protein